MAELRNVAIDKTAMAVVDNIYSQPSRSITIPAYLTRAVVEEIRTPENITSGYTGNVMFPNESNTYAVRQLDIVYGLEITSRMQIITEADGIDKEFGRLFDNAKPFPGMPHPNYVVKQPTGVEPVSDILQPGVNWSISPWLSYFHVRAWPFHWMCDTLTIKMGSTNFSSTPSKVILAILHTLGEETLKTHGQNCFGMNARRNYATLGHLASITGARNPMVAKYDGPSTVQQANVKATAFHSEDQGLLFIAGQLWLAANRQIDPRCVPEFAVMTAISSGSWNSNKRECSYTVAFDVRETLISGGPFLPRWQSLRTPALIIPTTMLITFTLHNNIGNRIVLPRQQMILGEFDNTSLKDTRCCRAWQTAVHTVKFNYFTFEYTSRDPQSYFASQNVNTSYIFPYYQAFITDDEVTFNPEIDNRALMSPFIAQETKAKTFRQKFQVDALPNSITLWVQRNDEQYTSGPPCFERGMSPGHITKLSMELGNKTGLLSQFNVNQLNKICQDNNRCHDEVAITHAPLPLINASTANEFLTKAPGGVRYVYPTNGSVIHLSPDEWELAGVRVPGVDGAFSFRFEAQACPNLIMPWGYIYNYDDTGNFQPLDLMEPFKFNMHAVTSNTGIYMITGTHTQVFNRLFFSTEVGSIISSITSSSSPPTVQTNLLDGPPAGTRRGGHTEGGQSTPYTEQRRGGGFNDLESIKVSKTKF